jgi:enoyl-CoA hydratase/carnithine racemase
MTGDGPPIREVVDLGLGGVTRGLHTIRKPIVGAINGWALAGGLEQAMACDIRIASERARFGSFEARRGYHHGDGGIVRLVNACGTAVASHMLLTAEPVDARAGARVHMVTRVVPARAADGRGPRGPSRARSCATPSARCAARRRRSPR